MIFTDIPSGESVFIDANTFIYAAHANVQYGVACIALLKRIEQNDVKGVTSSHVLADVAHRAMTLEACQTFGWSYQGIAGRLKSHRKTVQQLSQFRQALEEILQLGLQVVPITEDHLRRAASLSQQHGIMTNDALVVAVMEEHNLTYLASRDEDFDVVPAIQRAGPC